MALDIQKLSRTELHTIWNALQQFVDNQDDSCEPEEWSDTVKAEVQAAQELIAEIDTHMAREAC